MVRIGLLAAIGFVLAGPAQAVAKDKHGGGPKVSVDKHRGSDGGDKHRGSDGGDKHRGSDGGDKHRGSDGGDKKEGSNLGDRQGRSNLGDRPGGSDQSDRHGGSDGGDRDTPNAQAGTRQAKAGVHKDETSVVKDEVSNAKGKASAVKEGVSARERADLAKSESASNDDTAGDVTTTANRATSVLATADVPSKRLSSPKQLTTTAKSAGANVSALVGTTGDEVLSHVESAARQLTSTAMSAVDRITVRVGPLTQPVTSVLKNSGITVGGQLVLPPGAAIDALASEGPVSTPGRAEPPTGATSPFSRQPHAPVQSAVHDGPLTALGAAGRAATAAVVSNGLASTDFHAMGTPTPWVGIGASDAAAGGLHPAMPPPPRPPPVSMPPFTGGFALTLLFSTFAALLAAGLAAPKAGRETLLSPVHWRPLLFVSALERPG